MDDSTKKHLADTKTWTRIIYIILFAIAFNVAEFIIAAITVVQFFTVLFTGRRNDRLAEMGGSIGEYLSEVTAFLTYNSDHMPFPVSDWGQGPERQSASGRQARANKSDDTPTPSPSAKATTAEDVKKTVKKTAKKKAVKKKSAKKEK
ncbi:MAG: DUF4389 domain-containing protein [Rhodospirillaceae bacterium]|nr:DUF4389 domain-containing protein [Rhodospirillaceae bacterium]